ncbi:MAG: TldD/PmbA family protein [Candidatus Eisenbacteria bacterium]
MSVDYVDLASDITREAKAEGADDCDCFIETGRELTIKVRQGEIESIERASFRGMGIRFFSGQRLGFGYTTDFSEASIANLLGRCRAFALAATPDPDAGIPESRDIEPGDLEINDPGIDQIPLSKKTDLILACENAAYECDKRIKHTYSSAYEEQKGRVIIAKAGRDPIFYDATSFAIFCAPVAEEGGEKRMGMWVSDGRFLADLEPAKLVGETAARRALAMLGAQTPRTQKATVVFDPIAASEVVAEVFKSLDGERVLRGMSFLGDRLGQRIGSEAATFVDDGRLPRKLGSRPFDGEGIPTRRVVAIEKGLLKSYFYDYRSSRKAGTTPGGNARRGFASIPQVGENNFYLIPGRLARQDLIKGVRDGFLVTRLLGFGVNLTTGDYSRGAEGLWIKDGKVCHPVDGVTIASNLGEMLEGIQAVGSDLRFYGRFGSPTFAVREMTIGGE